ncbi:MAG: right-handed parallel beta-helix repeat-containing protein [Promethearchaeota archaeon]
MVKGMKAKSHRLVLLFLISLILLGTLGGISAISSQKSLQNQSIESINGISSEGNRPSSLSSYSIDWNSLIPLSPQEFTSREDLQNYTSPDSGDGTSWESPLILDHYLVEQNSSVAGLRFTNFSQYLVIQNCVFRNLYSGFREDSYSILLNYSQNIKIESSYFTAYSGSHSNAFRLEHSNNINITDNNINFYNYGIVAHDSEDFTISNNHMYNNKYEHIRFRNVRSISIENNEIISQSISYKDVDGIYGWNVSQCMISNNQFKEDVYSLDFTSSQDITFIGNELPYLDFYIAAEINITQNEICGGISFLFGVNATISQNTIKYATNAIHARNTYNFLIEKNTFRYISGYVFELYYYDDESHDYEPIWFETPANSRQLITQNTIFMVGRGIMKETSAIVQFRFNFIFFHTGHYIFMVFSLICGGYYLYTLFIQRKKIKTLDNLQKTLQMTLQSPSDDLPHNPKSAALEGLDLMRKHEHNLTHIVSFQMLFVFGILFSFTYFESFYTGDFIRTVLELFLPENYYSDVPLRGFLVSWELLLLGFFLAKINLRKLQKIRIIPPILHNTGAVKEISMDTNFLLSKSEKILLGTCLGVGLIIEILILQLVYFGAYEAILIVLGIVFALGFIVNLIWRITKHTQKVWIVIGLLGFILISAYLIIRRSMNPNNVWSSNPDEVEWTQKTLFWSFFILGGIGWAGAYFRDEELSFQQGEN